MEKADHELKRVNHGGLSWRELIPHKLGHSRKGSIMKGVKQQGDESCSQS